MKQWQLIIAAIVIAAGSAIGGYQFQQHLKQSEKASEQTSPKIISQKDLIGSQVDDFSLLDTEDEQRSLSEWQGKVVAINFWATWCPPCLEEIPHFVELQKQYGNEGLQFVGVAMEHADEVHAFLLEFEMNYPSLIGGDQVIKLAKKLGNDIGALPYTVILDRQGKIAFIRRGALSKSDAESVIQRLL